MELLIVLVLIGIILGFVGLSTNLGGASQQLEQDSKRLLALLNHSSQTAILDNQPYALRFDKQGYYFYRYQLQADGFRWLALSQHPQLYDRAFKPYTQFHLSLNDDQHLINDKASQPQLIFFNDGSYTAFKAILQHEYESIAYQLEGNGFATIQLKQTSGL